MHAARLAFFAALFATPALADDVTVTDAYMRVASPVAQSAAAFMVIENTGAAGDRLVAARSDAAERVELHTHIEDGDVMRMRQVEDGFEIPAGGSHALARGGDHVMFMGLARPLEQGDTVDVTLEFEQAGTVDLTVAVNPDGSGHGGHGQMHGDGHGHMSGDGHGG